MKRMFTNKVPVLLVGPPGVGKTAIVNSSFDYAEIMLASTMVEEDIAGIPYREGQYDLRTIPSLFRRLYEADLLGKTTALFIDELDKARRSVADTLLTLIASRKVGEAYLPSNTCIIAAANPPSFGGGDGISDAMISRFSVIDFVPSVKKWVDWAKKRYSSKECMRVIEKINCGEIPIIDSVGDGLEKRISSPRTITMALDYLEGGHDNFEDIARGLLTALVASKIIFYAFEVKDITLEKSQSVRIKANKNNKIIEPIRL